MAQRVVAGIQELKGLIGHEVGISEWFEVTQAHIADFAEVTQDRQWIHLDAERARSESPYRATIAHGFLTLSLLSYLHSQAVQVRGDHKMGINYGLNRVRFPAPVPAGSRIRARSTLQSLDDVPHGAQVVWNVTVEIEGGSKPAMVAEWVVRLLH
jgi:acyl dehydratase